MGAKGQSKYDYGTNGGKDVYGVDAPDFRESKEFEVYVDTVKAIIYAETEIPSRRIKEELGGLNNDHWTAAALDRLCSGNEVEAVGGPLWIRYRAAPPVKPKKEVPISGEKLKEYKAWQRRQNETYPTYTSII